MQVKYRLQGEDTQHRAIRIDIGDDVYQGAITTLPLTSAILTREHGDGGILATALSITAQSMKDGDTDALYVRDSTRWNVELYIDNIIYWRGYILRELKETQYRNAPCEVKIQAIDGIGILKDIKYRPSHNRISLWGVVTWIVTRTRLNCELCALSNIIADDEGLPSSYSKWLDGVYINDAVFEGMTAYDILAVITENLSAYFTQIGGNFIFFRTERVAQEVGAMEILSTSKWYTLPKTGVIGSVASDAEYHPVGTMSEDVDPAKKRLSVTIERKSASALGVANLRVALPTWGMTDTPVYYVHSVDGQTQLFVSHGRISRKITMKAPSYPMKMTISGATLGRGKMFIRMYTNSRYVHDFQRKLVGENDNRWYYYGTTGLPEAGEDVELKGQLSLTGSYPASAIPYNFYRIDKVAAAELEIDAFPTALIGSSTTLTIEMWFDKDDEFTADENWQKQHGVFMDEVTLTTEAFGDHELYVALNEDASDEAEEYTMALQETPDDNGGTLFIPGALTYSNGLPVHKMMVMRRNGSTFTTLNELLARERAEQFKIDRKILKGEILGNDAFNHIFFSHKSDSRIYRAVNLESDLLRRVTNVELVEFNRDAVLNYPLLSKDDIEEDYDTIAALEYRLNVTIGNVPAKGGVVAKTVRLEKYEYGVLVSRSNLTSTEYTIEVISYAPYVTISGRGNSISVEKQALVAGKERTFQLLFSTTSEEIKLSKVVTVRQEANTYIDSNKVLSQRPGVVMDYNHVYKLGGVIQFVEYSNYRYIVDRTWASGDVQNGVEVMEAVRMEFLEDYPGVTFIESSGVYFGIDVDYEVSSARYIKFRVTNSEGGDAEEYQITQLALYRVITGMKIRLFNAPIAFGQISNIIDNVSNKGTLAYEFTPSNARDRVTVDIGYAVTSGASIEGDVITITPTTGDFTLTATTERDGIVATLDVIATYNY